MHHMFIRKSFYALLLLAISPAVVSQTVSPGPTHDCSNEVVYIGDLACNNDVHNCCGATETCCAGGCCSVSEVCVFQGTANEACCPMGDPTFCGEPAAPKGTCPSSTASVPCSGIDSSWYCSAGCTCNVSVDHGCNCFTSCDDTPESSSSSGVAAASSSTTEDSTPAAASSTQSVEDTSTSEAAVSTTDDSTPAAATSTEVLSVQTQTSIETSAAKITSQSPSQGSTAATTAGSGSGSSTTSGTAPAATTTSASGAWTRGVETHWALALAIGTIIGVVWVY